MRNKLIATLLASLLLFGCILPVGATEAAAPIYGSVALIDEQICITLAIRGGSRVESGSFTLTYDTGLILVKAESALQTQDVNVSEAGKVRFSWTEQAPTEDLTVLELILSGGETGVYDFHVQELLVWDDSFQAVEAEPFTISLTIACDGQEGCPSGAFQDVDQTQWYHEAVDHALENGIMEGVGNQKFAPNANLTRGMLVKILGSVAEMDPADHATSSFADVDPDAWYGPYVQWAYENGLVQGVGNGLFMPNAQITRQEVATILYRYWKSQGNTWTADKTAYKTFSDISDVAPWAAEAMAWAVGVGLIEGVGDQMLAPKGTATRAQAAKIIMLYERL